MVRDISKILQKDYPERPDIDAATLDHNTSLWWMAEMAGYGKDVLDVGCATGYLANLLKSKGCTVTGIDLNAGALAEAKAHCKRVIQADLDVQSLADAVGRQRFDVVLFGDVLEHLRDPLGPLSDARKLLRPGGRVILSIPNIAHGAIRLALLQGTFNYSDLGILDATHLRFFTRKTLEEFLLKAGFSVERTERTVLPLFAESNLVPELNEADFDPALVAEIREDAEHETLQFVVEARAIPERKRFEDLFGKYTRVNTELETATVQRRRLRATLERDVAEYKALLDTERARSGEAEAALTEEIARLRTVEIDLRGRIAERQAAVENINEQLMALQRSANETRGADLEAIVRLRGVEAQLREQLAAQGAAAQRLQQELEETVRAHAARCEAYEREKAETEAQQAATEMQLASAQTREAELRQNYDDAVAELETERTNYNALEAALHDERTALNAAQEALENARQTLGRERDDFARLQERFADAQTQLERLADAERRLERLSDVETQLERVTADRNDLRGQFLMQTDALLDRTRRETRQLSHLIELVQSSRFWSFKRALARLRPRGTR